VHGWLDALCWKESKWVDGPFGDLTVADLDHDRVDEHDYGRTTLTHQTKSAT
jgi:hypothetical protein